MKIENMIVGVGAEPYLARCDVVTWLGVRRRTFVCDKIGRLTGGNWIDAQTGEPMHWADAHLLNCKANLVQTPVPRIIHSRTSPA
jgi:hypothetical protein